MLGVVDITERPLQDRRASHQTAYPGMNSAIPYSAGPEQVLPQSSGTDRRSVGQGLIETTATVYLGVDSSRLEDEVAMPHVDPMDPKVGSPALLQEGRHHQASMNEECTHQVRRVVTVIGEGVAITAQQWLLVQ